MWNYNVKINTIEEHGSSFIIRCRVTMNQWATNDWWCSLLYTKVFSSYCYTSITITCMFHSYNFLHLCSVLSNFVQFSFCGETLWFFDTVSYNSEHNEVLYLHMICVVHHLQCLISGDPALTVKSFQPSLWSCCIFAAWRSLTWLTYK